MLVSKRQIITLLFLCFILGCNSDLTILSYNVHDLFDDTENGTEYPKYSVNSGKWNSELFHIKLKRTAYVIQNACPGAPDIVCLQEVENQNALSALNSLYLKDQGYEYCVLVPGQDTVTNVGLLCRYPVIRTNSHYVGRYAQYHLRNILEVKINYKGNILYIFNNHWKSKVGQVEAVNQAHLKAAAVILKRVESIKKEEKAADIIIVGDLNENVEEYLEIEQKYQTAIIPFYCQVPEEYNGNSIFITRSKEDTGNRNGKTVFYNVWYDMDKLDWGSYMYKDQWCTLDHILLGDGLFDNQGFFYEGGNFRVIRSSFLLDPKTGFPLKWEPGHKTIGYSDHLPLLLQLSVAEK